MIAPTQSVDSGASEDVLTATISAQKADTRTLSYLHRAIPSLSHAAFSDAAETGHAVPQPGMVLGTYVLQEKLGEGVSSHVYRAWDDSRNSAVANKMIDWSKVYDRSAAMKQLRTEAITLSRVKHPRVVGFIDFGFDPRWPYLVTEYFEGQPLGELLRDGGALPPRWALAIVSQVADALGAVWKAGLVHRDIKPDNILIGADGNTKLIDFGLTTGETLRAVRDESGPELAGTAAYLSPEQAKNARAADLRADIYSLGVTLYHLLTGRLPFDARNRVQMIFHHLTSVPAPPASLAEDIPELLSDLCLWMLAKEPADRPQNYDELHQSLVTVSEALLRRV